MADTVAWVARATKKRFEAGFTATSTGEDQLSVGIGGDIPMFPPFLVVTLPLIGLFFKAILPRCPVLPTALDTKTVRASTFVVSFILFVLVVKNTELTLADVGTSADFAAVSSVATTGVFAYTRNPIYTAGMTVLNTGIVVACNSLYVALAVSLLVFYLTLIVVPVEEAFLSNRIGSSYIQYIESSVPRYLPNTFLWAVGVLLAIHLVEFAVKFKDFRAGKIGEGGMLKHFLMTFVWGIVYWKPLEAEETMKEKKKKKKKKK